MALNTRMQDWQGQRVWLVGASTGIGRATAAALHARGAQVLVSARSAGGLAEFVAAHPGAQSLALDVCDDAAVPAAVQTVLAGGRLDCVVYCAGHYQAMRADHMDMGQLLRHNEVNYLGALRLLHALVPALLRQPPDARSGLRGHISLMGSVAGYRGLPQSLAYGPTKAALINLSENLYLDLHAMGLGVSLISPGFVDTPLTAQNTFRMPALISSAQAADAILQGWARGDFEIHFPRRFTIWMKVLQLLPYRAYFALTRRLNHA